MKRVQYKITEDFGLREIGEIIEAYLIASDSPFYLIFHPKTRKGESASIEICIKESGYFVSKDSDSFINLSSKEAKIFEGLK